MKLQILSHCWYCKVGSWFRNALGTNEILPWSSLMFYLRFFSRFGHPENFSVNHGCCSGNRFQIERIAQPRIMETFERDRNCFVVSFTDVYVVSIWILRMSHMIASHCYRMIVVGVLYKRRENASDQITIRSSFESDWFRRWRELSGPITRRG